ncbi:MAG: ATP-binding protein [Oscillospiraceae bacterium]|nr:ATP-binding protein [Oscillospiraceae bacterium]
MTEKNYPADDSALDDVLAFVEEELEKADCPMKTVMAITVAIEEVFVNVSHYAYPNGSGEASLSIDFDSESRLMTFVLKDSGIPFNPLAKPDPDITLSAEERQIGGLGIYMMKKTMDEVSYAYKDEKNILTMKKTI